MDNFKHMTKDQLLELHTDLTLEISYTARHILELQRSIQDLDLELLDLEAEIDERELVEVKKDEPDSSIN